MTEQVCCCQSCGEQLTYQRYHAGHSDLGYLYCDTDSAVVTWSSYEPEYSKLSANIHPWMLDEKGKAVIEQAVIDCPYGGHFRFNAMPRCSLCLAELPQLATDPIYVVVTGRQVSSADQQIWKTGANQ